MFKAQNNKSVRKDEVEISASQIAKIFSNSAITKKLLNFSLHDYGEKLRKVRLTIGNANVGIYKQNRIKKSSPKDCITEDDLYAKKLSKMRDINNIRTRKKIFKQQMENNLFPEDNLTFITLTFNTTQNNEELVGYNFNKDNCPMETKLGRNFIHVYKKVSYENASFLTGKEEILGRKGIDGTADYFSRFINNNIKKHLDLRNFKYAMVAELHKCQVSSHWILKKTKENKKQNFHDPNLSPLASSQPCKKQFHYHLQSNLTYLLYKKYPHECPFFTKKTTCKDCTFLLNHLWRWGYTNIKSIENENIQKYLSKYMYKATILKETEEGRKHGVFKNSRFYMLFRRYKDDEGNYIKVNTIKKKSYSFIVTGTDNNVLSNYWKKYYSHKNYKITSLSTSDISLEDVEYEITEELEKLSPETKKILNIFSLCNEYADKKLLSGYEYWKQCIFDSYSKLCKYHQKQHFDSDSRFIFDFNKESYDIFFQKIMPLLEQVQFQKITKFKDYKSSLHDLDSFQMSIPRVENELDVDMENYKYKDYYTLSEPEKLELIPTVLLYNYGYIPKIVRSVRTESEAYKQAELARKRFGDE